LAQNKIEKTFLTFLQNLVSAYRILNDRQSLFFKVPDMILSFASGATISLAAKNGIKKILPLQLSIVVWLIWRQKLTTGFLCFLLIRAVRLCTRNFKSIRAKLKAVWRFSFGFLQ